MQSTVFLSLLAFLWITSGSSPATVMLANAAADQIRAARDLQGLAVIERFELYGTETARAAIVTAETAGRVLRVDNGTTGRILLRGRTGSVDWCKIQLSDGTVLYADAAYTH